MGEAVLRGRGEEDGASVSSTRTYATPARATKLPRSKCVPKPPASEREAKTHPPMMPLLPADILHHGIELAALHCERRSALIYER